MTSIRRRSDKTILLNQKFGHLSVINFVNIVNDESRWLCRCDCGKEKILRYGYLKYNRFKSCGCRGSTLNNKTSLNAVYSTYKMRAKLKNTDFTIGQEEFVKLIQEPCFYCGILNSNLKKIPNGQVQYNGLDRVDNSKGYVPENVVTCCKTCNMAKHSMSQSDFIEFIKRVFNYIVENNKDIVK